MVNYRRNQQKGATYFFTVTLQNRKQNHLIQHIPLLQQAIYKTKQKLPYRTIATVILPEHIHTIWELPENDSNYATRWRSIKSHFTQSLVKHGTHLIKDHRGQYNIWQKRFWEHTIKNEHDLQAHVDYIHYNPVKHGLVKCPSDWPYSTFHWYVKQNLLPKHWGAGLNYIDMEFGE